MALSRITKVGDGSTKIFTVNFALDYLSEDDVTARVGSETDGLGDPVYRDITFLATQLMEISGAAPGDGVNIVFERTVPKEELKVNFNDGDVMDEANLDTAQKQTMMAVHEVLDGRLPAFTANLSMGGFKITDLGTPTEPSDAVPLSFVGNAPAEAAAALAARIAAQAARDTAVTNAGLTSADRVQTGLDRVQTGEDRIQTGLDRANAASDATAAAQAVLTAKLDKSGGILTGALVLAGNPGTANTAANKAYVDAGLTPASQAEAEAGTDNVKPLSSLRGKQSVLRHTAAASVAIAAGAVGSFAYAATLAGAGAMTAYGGTISGSLLQPVGTSTTGNHNTSGIPLTGTWRCLGYLDSGSARACMWQRIS